MQVYLLEDSEDIVTPIQQCYFFYHFELITSALLLQKIQFLDTFPARVTNLH